MPDMERVILELDGMSLDELSDIVKSAFSRMYTKLRDEEGFGYNQTCVMTSFGPEDYDIDFTIMDDESHCRGLDWPRCWRS